MIKIKSQIWEITFATSDMKWLLCLIHMSLYKLIRKNNNTPNKKDGQRKRTTNPSIPKKEEKYGKLTFSYNVQFHLNKNLCSFFFVFWGGGVAPVWLQALSSPTSARARAPAVEV